MSSSTVPDTTARGWGCLSRCTLLICVDGSSNTPLSGGAESQTHRPSPQPANQPLFPALLAGCGRTRPGFWPASPTPCAATRRGPACCASSAREESWVGAPRDRWTSLVLKQPPPPCWLYLSFDCSVEHTPPAGKLFTAPISLYVRCQTLIEVGKRRDVGIHE